MAALEVTREMFEEFKKGDLPVRKFRVASGSMEPLIPVGMEVAVGVGQKCHRFDVVAFWGEGRLTCHVLWHINTRIMDQGQTIYHTCSLRGQGMDLSIREEDLLGPILNYRLSLWEKLRMAWRRRRQGL